MTNNNSNNNNNNRQEKTFYDGVESEIERRHRIYEEEELKKCGVQTYRRKKREVPEWDKVTVISVGEIEVSDELDSFVKAEILDGYALTYPKWIQRCYIERMKQILNDPEEFGKIVLESKKRDHSIQDVDDLDVEDC